MVDRNLPHDAHTPEVRRLRGRLFATLALKSTLGWMAIWAFIWGTAVLISRGAVGVDRLPLAWGALGFVLAIVLGLEAARRKTPGLASVRAVIDRHAAAGGLVMAGAEADTSAWAERMTAQAARRGGPTVRWNAQRSWGMLALAGVFVAVAFAMPARFVQIAQARPLDVTEQADRLAEQIETLAEEEIIDDKRAADLAAKLEQVKGEATADKAVQTWEALDQLESSLAQLAQEAAARAIEDTRKLAEAGALGEALADDQNQPAPELSEGLRDAAMRDLAERVEAMTKESAQIRKAFNASKIDPKKIAPQPEMRLKQVFLDKDITPELRQKIREAMAEMGLDPEQIGDVEDKELQAIKDALADDKLDADERKMLTDQLAEHQREKAKMRPISDEQLAELKKKLAELGLDEQDFALIPQDAAERLTPEQLERLKELAEKAEPGTRYRQVYLNDLLPPQMILRARLAVMRVQVDAVLSEHELAKKLPAAAIDAAWNMATDRLVRAAAGDPDAGVLDPAVLDAAAQLAPDPQAKAAVEALAQVDPAVIQMMLQMVVAQLPNAEGFNRHVGLVDEDSIGTLRRVLGEQPVTDEEFAALEAALEPHKLPVSELPFDLTFDQLLMIDLHLRELGLADAEFALLPPQERLTPEQMEQIKQMAGACKACEQGLAQRLAKLAEMKMIDAKALEQAQQAGQCDGKGLAKFLADRAGQMTVDQMMQQWAQSGLPGRGGINRGRADAAMTWQDGADESGAKFKEQTLPQGALNPAHSQNTGESLGAPEVAEDGPAVASTQLKSAQAGGGSADTQTVLPRHRGVVERYFERGE